MSSRRNVSVVDINDQSCHLTEDKLAFKRGFVGLTRIELVTSSLSGMRSNQLSYSPELLGAKSLTALFVSLNRHGRNLFFQHGDPDTANEVGDEIEDHGTEHPNDRAECGQK